MSDRHRNHQVRGYKPLYKSESIAKPSGGGWSSELGRQTEESSYAWRRQPSRLRWTSFEEIIGGEEEVGARIGEISLTRKKKKASISSKKATYDEDEDDSEEEVPRPCGGGGSRWKPKGTNASTNSKKKATYTEDEDDSEEERCGGGGGRRRWKPPKREKETCDEYEDDSHEEEEVPWRRCGGGGGGRWKPKASITNTKKKATYEDDSEEEDRCGGGGRWKPKATTTNSKKKATCTEDDDDSEEERCSGGGRRWKPPKREKATCEYEDDSLEEEVPRRRCDGGGRKPKATNTNTKKKATYDDDSQEEDLPRRCGGGGGHWKPKATSTNIKKKATSEDDSQEEDLPWRCGGGRWKPKGSNARTNSKKNVTCSEEDSEEEERGGDGRRWKPSNKKKVACSEDEDHSDVFEPWNGGGPKATSICVTKFNLFGHPHSLVLHNAVPTTTYDCAMCAMTIRGSHYTCLEDGGFVIDKQCLDLPRKIEHELYPSHTFKFQPKFEQFGQGDFHCNACLGVGPKSPVYMYHCSTRNINLHVACAGAPRTKMHNGFRLYICYNYFVDGFVPCGFCKQKIDPGAWTYLDEEGCYVAHVGCTYRYESDCNAMIRRLETMRLR